MSSTGISSWKIPVNSSPTAVILIGWDSCSSKSRGAANFTIPLSPSIVGSHSKTPVGFSKVREIISPPIGSSASIIATVTPGCASSLTGRSVTKISGGLGWSSIIILIDVSNWFVPSSIIISKSELLYCDLNSRRGPEITITSPEGVMSNTLTNLELGFKLKLKDSPSGSIAEILPTEDLFFGSWTNLIWLVLNSGKGFSVSQTSPIPSPSLSSCLGLYSSGQLSSISTIPSSSVSLSESEHPFKSTFSPRGVFGQRSKLS